MSVPTAPSSPPPTLLTIPPELRNTIFALALTSSTDLVQAHDTTNDTTDARLPFDPLKLAHRHPFNQLKLVNRQRHTETKDVEFQHNDLRFTQNALDDTTALPKATAYLVGLSPQKLSWVRSVTLAPMGIDCPFCETMSFDRGFGRQNNVTARDLIDFCKAYPAIAVRYVMPTWKLVNSQQAIQFLMMGSAIQALLRGGGSLVSAAHPPEDEREAELRELGGAALKFRVLPAVKDIHEGWYAKLTLETLGYGWERM
jgi:hypothetical protein